MEASMLRHLVYTAVMLVAASPALSQSLLDVSEVAFITDLGQMQVEADRYYRGDHLILIYDDSERSEACVQQLFANDTISAFVTEHFAAMAVRADTPEAQQIMEVYSGGGEAPWIIISAQRLDGLTLHDATQDVEGFMRLLSAIKRAKSIEDFRAGLESM
jgi:hypothetical protein